MATVAAAITLGAMLRTAAGATTDADIVACYDATRKVVSHTLSQDCDSEIISPRREHDLEMAERRRIQSAVDSRSLPDPITGKRRLTGTGSGFYVSREGEILTNDHVVNQCNMLTATADDDSKHAALMVATSRPHWTSPCCARRDCRRRSPASARPRKPRMASSSR
jgi:S1-C subfamily serine protease